MKQAFRIKVSLTCICATVWPIAAKCKSIGPKLLDMPINAQPAAMISRKQLFIALGCPLVTRDIMRPLRGSCCIPVSFDIGRQQMNKHIPHHYFFRHVTN